MSNIVCGDKQNYVNQYIHVNKEYLCKIIGKTFNGVTKNEPRWKAKLAVDHRAIIIKLDGLQ